MYDPSGAGPSNFASRPSSSALIPDALSLSPLVEEEQMTLYVAANRTVINSAVGGVRMFFTDPDVLDCPICQQPLSSPVFQCENGHIACSSCCSRANTKCPCGMPIGHNRCRAFEKIIESIKVLCKNGCKETMPYSKKNEHERMCPNATCFCPHPSCTFADFSKKLYLHFGIQHAASTTRFTYNTSFCVLVKAHQKHIFLQEQHESVVFILNHEVKECGQRALSVDCVGPSTLKTCFEYSLTTLELGSSLCLQSVPEVYTKWFEHSLRKFYLTIPSDFYSYMEPLRIHLCIKKALSPVLVIP